MESQPLSELYEVRCYHCNCSFAPGTKQCIHCGQRLGIQSPLELALGAARGRGGSADAQREELQAPGFARIALWVASAGLALGLSLLRTCER